VGLDPSDIWRRFVALRKKAIDWLDGETVDPGDRTIAYSVDLRYEQQGFEVTVPVAAELVSDGGDLASIIADFHAQHEMLYGVRFSVPVELVALRVVATGATLPVDETPPEASSTDLKAAMMERRPCYFNGGWVDTPNYDRSKMGVGAKIDGPAVIRQYDATCVLLPGHYAVVDEHGNILIWPNARGSHSDARHG
jgi:N-methylhydantoinase A